MSYPKNIKRAKNKNTLNKDLFKDVNSLSLKRVKDFWSAYGLDFPYKSIEHRPELIGKRLIYIRKGDYGILIADENGHFTIIVIKTRGIREENRSSAPIPMMFIEALHGNENPKLPAISYVEARIASPNDFKMRHTLKEVLTGQIKFIPGQTIYEEKQTRLNNTHCFIYKIADNRSRVGRASRKTRKMFEPIALTEGLKIAIKAMNLNNVNYSEQ